MDKNMLITLAVLSIVLALLVQPELAKLPFIGSFAGVIIGAVAAFETYKLSQSKGIFALKDAKDFGVIAVLLSFLVIALGGLLPLVGMVNPLNLPAAGLAGLGLILGLL